jgi:hypothetical protein
LRDRGAVALVQPLGAQTHRLLEKLQDDPENCRAALDAVNVQATPVAEQYESAGGCSLKNALVLHRSTLPYSGLVRGPCAMNAALYLWETQVVAPAAKARLKTSVARVEVIGSYSCRTRNSKPGAPLSEHATGNAIDIAGFKLKDGRTIVVKDDWRSLTPEGAFIRDVRDGGCRIFKAVLSPDYNAAHHDHLHFDLGRDTLCR